MTRLLLKKRIETSREIVIEDDELHYLTRVRRHGVGDEVELRDNTGRRFLGRIVSIDRTRAVLAAERELPPAPTSLPINIIVAVPKQNLMDEVVRKTSEIGVERLVPIVAERTVARPGPGRLDRWERIAAESRRQCGRERPLVVDEVRPLDSALAEFSKLGTKYVLHTGADRLPSLLAAERITPPITFLVGPEGGFTDAELDQCARLGYEPVRFGHSILRVETAAIVAAVLGVAFLASE